MSTLMCQVRFGSNPNSDSPYRLHYLLELLVLMLQKMLQLLLRI